MSNSDDFAAIRELCEQYCQQQITKEEYRTARTALLNKIDYELNSNNKRTGVDAEVGFLDKIISVFKNKDEEKMT